MTNHLYYPNTSFSLSEIDQNINVNSNRSSNVSALALANPQVSGPDNTLPKNSPIILPGGANNGAAIPRCTAQEHRRLGALSHQVGGAATLAMAELVDELKIPSFSGDLNTFGGNGIGVAAKASNIMVSDIANYDKVLKEFHDLENNRAVPATKARKRVELTKAYEKMNQSLDRRGQQILHKHAVKTREVTNQRGYIVRESIPLSNNAEVQKLAKLAKFGRVAGPGFVLLDGFFRYDKVAAMYKQNNTNWKREAIIQTSGFVAGIGAGIAIAFFIGFAPVGIVVGVIAAGTLAVVADKAATGIVGDIYDLAK